jgi:homoserine kinase
MSPFPQSVSVRIPGSTSNCGSGFDTLGLALNLYNRVTVQIGGKQAVPERPRDAAAQELVAGAARAFFEATRTRPVGFSYRIEGEVPPARGLGSSATIIAGVLAGLDGLVGTDCSRNQLVALATAQEGHPDNASAGILGGFCVTRCDPATGAHRDTIRFAVPHGVAFAFAAPHLEMPTKQSRAVLPSSVPFADAARSINSAAYLVAAFASCEFTKLRHVAGDFMHEPYRLPLIPGAREAIEAGMAEGAFTGWLSGSGSGVICVCSKATGDAVGAAMRRAFSKAGIGSDIRVLRADNQGLRLE